MILALSTSMVFSCIICCTLQPCNNSISYCVGQPNLTVGQAYLSIYEFPTTFLQGYWVPVIILTCYYCILTSLCFYTVGNIRHDEVCLSIFEKYPSSLTSIIACPNLTSFALSQTCDIKVTIVDLGRKFVIFVGKLCFPFLKCCALLDQYPTLSKLTKSFPLVCSRIS